MARFDIPKSVIMTCISEVDAMTMFLGFVSMSCSSDSWVYYLRLQIAMGNPLAMQYYKSS